MHRFTIKRKIGDTLLGATYECERRINPPPSSIVGPSHSRARSSVAVKCSSLCRRQELTSAGLTSAMPNVQSCLFALDDPLRERSVVAKLIASGGHSNVLQCYDTFVGRGVCDTSAQDTENDDRWVFIVTEFCSGGDLFQRLSASPTGTIDQHEALLLISQVANGLAFLHSLGFAHRDLSLENVLLRGDTCKVADFGAAIDVTERCSDRVGKQQYMAPEIVVADASNTYDPRAADVWSLGVMLFMLLTGSPLACVASREDPGFVALEKHGVGAILMAWGMGEEHVVSSEVVAVLGSMLQVDPERRIRVPQLVTRLEAVSGLLVKREECSL